MEYSDMTYAGRAIRGTLLLFILSLFSSGLAYLLRIILARNLTPAEYGLFYSILSLFALLAIFQHLGLNDALIKYLAEFHAQGQKIFAKSAIIQTLIFQFLTAGILFILGMIFAPTLAQHYYQTPTAIPIIRWLAFSILLSPLELIFAATFVGFQKINYFSIMNFLRMLFLIITSLIFLHYGFGILAPAFAYVFVYIIPPVIYYPLFKKIFPTFWQVPFTWDLVISRKLFHFGIPIIITSFAGQIIQYIDTIMLTGYRTLEEVGWYQAATPTARLLWLFGEAAMIVLFPISSELWAKNKKLLQQSIPLVYKYLLIIIIPPAIILILFPKLALTLLFGTNYLPAADTLRVLSIGAIALTLANLNHAIINGAGKPLNTTRNVIIAALTNILLNIFLIPSFGVLGAALATTTSFIILFLLSNWGTWGIKKTLNISFDFQSSLTIFLANALFITTLLLSTLFLTMNPYLEAIISILLAGALYIILLFVFRIITPLEIKDHLRHILS